MLKGLLVAKKDQMHDGRWSLGTMVNEWACWMANTIITRQKNKILRGWGGLKTDKQTDENEEF